MHLVSSAGQGVGWQGVEGSPAGGLHVVGVGGWELHVVGVGCRGRGSHSYTKVQHSSVLSLLLFF